jgi:hypothetical protein
LNTFIQLAITMLGPLTLGLTEDHDVEGLQLVGALRRKGDGDDAALKSGVLKSLGLESWPSTKRTIGSLETFWEFANGMNWSLNHTAPSSLSVHLLCDVLMALIWALSTGVGPSERINNGGMVRPEGETHSMTVMSSRLSDQT